MVVFEWLARATRKIVSLFRSEPAAPIAVAAVINVNPSVVAANPDEIELAIALDTSEPVVSQEVTAMQIARNLSYYIFTRENLPRIASATVLTALNTGLNFLSPYLFGETLKLLSSDEENATIGGHEVSRSVLIGMLLSAYALAQVLPTFRDQIMVPVTHRTTKKLITESIKHMMNKSLEYHVKTEFPDQLYFLQKGFSVGRIGSPLLTQIAPTLVEIAIACSVLSNRYGLELGAGLFGVLAAYTGYSAFTARHIVNAREASLEAGNGAFVELSTALAQYKTMRDLNRYADTMKEMEAALEKLYQAEVTAEARPLQIQYGYFAISRISMLIAALSVGLGIKSGKYSIEDFVVLIGYLNQLSSLLPAFGGAVNQLFASYPDLKFVFNELTKPDEVVDLHPDTPLLIVPGVAPSIEFDNVTFSYPAKPGEEEKPPLFQGLSFKIEPGQKVMLVSESGVGKTTIFNLLYSYYKPDQGSIKINGQDISQVSLNSLQQNIGLFGQTPNLSKGTVRENICYGAPQSDQINDNMIWTLAGAAGLHDFLEKLPQKLDTDVGDGGKQLSGGQQQKVAILRALSKQGTAIRMLDEVTAPFDSKSAREVLENINKLSAGMTSLMITHKLTEVQYVDIVIVLDKGKVIAQGTHNELLQSCALYQKLWKTYTQKEAGDQPLVSSAHIIKALGGANAATATHTHESAPTTVTCAKTNDLCDNTEKSILAASEIHHTTSTNSPEISFAHK